MATTAFFDAVYGFSFDPGLHSSWLRTLLMRMRKAVGDLWNHAQHPRTGVDTSHPGPEVLTKFQATHRSSALQNTALHTQEFLELYFPSAHATPEM